jgi:hypothetical protein
MFPQIYAWVRGNNVAKAKKVKVKAKTNKNYHGGAD